ncbi:hypothetical protein EUGRSUZ_B01381 [Eucalyptus grandis]|uniref:Uncharacterized protein n=2 Tax=Eucalyptus grandis TaxID=71139 RepID=A0ACC3LRH8_EUCGR|nr:hypothetical protein EUGRSUZ_B01381 [Eucalyptus grandis]
MRNPPSLLSLSIDSAVLNSAVLNLAHFSDLSPLPDHILLDLILKLWAVDGFRDVVESGLSRNCDEFVGYVQSANVMQFLCNGQYVIWGTFSFDCAMSRTSNLGRCLVSRIVVEFTPSMHAVCAGIIPDELSP